ncbi:Orotate phosphoribosyltransferase [Candidatus Paraburkholderia calva]|nr:Orotate phosphoribosyltransferase [Candidatus Paraburkholderia calva]
MFMGDAKSEVPGVYTRHADAPRRTKVGAFEHGSRGAAASGKMAGYARRKRQTLVHRTIRFATSLRQRPRDRLPLFKRHIQSKDLPMTGFDCQTISDTTAKMLLEVKSVHFNAEKPFIFTSGWASPVYIDCRKLISYPRVRRGLMEMAEATILRDVGYEQIDAVAGGETAGIPFAAWIADRLMVPMQYVRKKPKGFGRNAQIEGLLTEGQRVLLVEDLSTDSRSKINFINALRTAGAKVDHCFVLFHYNIFKESVSVLKDIDVDLHALATWWDVLRVAKEQGYFETSTLDEVEKFLHVPAEWSAAHGGATSAP